MQTPWLHGCLITWRIYLATAFLPLFNFKSECGIIFDFRHNKQADSVSIWSRSVSIPDAIPLAIPCHGVWGLRGYAKDVASTLPANLRGRQRNPNLVYYLAESLIRKFPFYFEYQSHCTRKLGNLRISRFSKSSIKIHFFTLRGLHSEVKSKMRQINFTKTSDNQVAIVL